MVTLKSTFRPELFERLPREMNASLAVTQKRRVLAVERRAKRFAPVESGSLAASIYHSVQGDSNYAENTQAAQEIYAAAHNGAAMETVPEIEAPADWKKGFVSFSAAHGFFQEYGTRFQAAQPFIGPATLQSQARDIKITVDGIREAVARAAAGTRRAA